MFRKLFKKKVKTILPGSQQHQPQEAKETMKIKPELAYLVELQKCLEQGCILSHLGFMGEEEITSTIGIVKQLLKISGSLKAQQLQNNELKKFYDSNRHIVSNHTAIVKGIEAMYEEKMMGVRDQHLKELQDKDGVIGEIKHQLESLKAKYTLLSEENITLSAQASSLKQKVETLQSLKTQMETENKALHKDISVYHSVRDNTKIPLSTLSPKQPIPFLFQSSISTLLFSFLSVRDIFTLAQLNKLCHNIVTSGIDMNRLLVRKSVDETLRWRRETMKDIKYFQSMIENINDYSIKQSALKYIYFHQKPGEYMLPSFKEFNLEEEKEKGKEREEERKRKNSRTFFGLFDNKEKKDESKINIKDLADPAYFKKVESKIEEYFSGTLDMKEDQPLKSFRETMLQQYEDVKKIVLHENQVVKMYQCAKFLYIESQELLRFCQYLFSEIVQISKKHQAMKSEYDDIREMEESMKNTLQIISSEKNKIQESNWLLEYDLKKYKLEIQTKEKQVEEATREVEKYKESYERTKTQGVAINKKNEDLFKKVTKLEKYLDSIKLLMLGESGVI